LLILTVIVSGAARKLDRIRRKTQAAALSARLKKRNPAGVFQAVNG